MCYFHPLGFERVCWREGAVGCVMGVMGALGSNCVGYCSKVGVNGRGRGPDFVESFIVTL